MGRSKGGAYYCEHKILSNEAAYTVWAGYKNARMGKEAGGVGWAFMSFRTIGLCNVVMWTLDPSSRQVEEEPETFHKI